MKSKSGFIILLAIISYSCSSSTFMELPEQEHKYFVTTETSLNSKETNDKIDEFFESADYQYLYGIDSLKIFYKVFENLDAVGAITISSGRTESIPKYKEVIYDLYRNGYSVFIHDHRGQGMSERVYKADPQIGHVENFQFYIDDLKTFYDSVVSVLDHKKRLLLGHSMGGAISTLYLEQYPNDFTAAALSSPMYGLSFPSCELINIVKGKEVNYALGQKNYEESKTPFEDNTLTNSEIRFNRMLHEEETTPQIRLGGPSYHWVSYSCEAMGQLYDEVDKIETPLLLLQGSDEKIVKKSSHVKVIEKMRELNKPVQAYTIEGAKHELLIEKDEYRLEVMNKILDFFEKF